eukprot:5945189-Prymnesium_polylepis.1
MTAECPPRGTATSRTTRTRTSLPAAIQRRQLGTDPTLNPKLADLEKVPGPDMESLTNGHSVL